jgi:DNA replication protein DnaC
MQILRPVFDVQVLVLDDLGAIRPSEWVSDTISLILNHRYNNKRTTIITTNYAAEYAGKGARNDAERIAREETLGDRIGNRMLDRLFQMCKIIEMQGDSFRRRLSLE